MTLSQLINDFLRDRQRADCRESSLRTYRTRLAPLVQALGRRSVCRLTRDELLDWLASQREDGRGRRRANATLALTRTLVKMLQTYALDEGHVEAPWLKPKDLKKPKPRRRDRTCTAAETAALVELMTPAYRRLYTAYRLTGARRSELCLARIEDLTHAAGRPAAIVLRHHKTSDKDGRDRVIHLGPEAARLVTEAVAGRTFGRIFLDDDGRPWKPSRVSAVFRRLRNALGLHKDLTVHCTRHEFASAVVVRHGLQEAQKLLGHANVQTTERYSHLQPEHLRRCLDGLYGPDQGGSDG